MVSRYKHSRHIPDADSSVNVEFLWWNNFTPPSTKSTFASTNSEPAGQSQNGIRSQLPLLKSAYTHTHLRLAMPLPFLGYHLS